MAVSLKIKLPLVITLLVFLSAAGVGYFLIRHEQRVFGEELSLRGEALARQLAGIERRDFITVARFVEEISKAEDIGELNLPTWFLAKRSVLRAALLEAIESPYVLEATYFNFESLPVLSMDTTSAVELKEEVEEELEPDSILISMHPDSIAVTLGEPDDGFTYVSPMLVGSDTLGYAQVRIDPRVLDSTINDALRSIWPVLAAIFGISIILSVLFSVLFTVPVSKLKNHALELAAGNLTTRVKLRSLDEMGVLGRVFNKMARSLQQSYDELQEKLVEIKRLFKMATEDGLTGVYVKRYFLELLAGELRRSIRYERPLSLLMCDIDHFKRVNDTYGHPAGDAVLRSIARRLTAATREGIDLIGRYGGEEFAIMLPEADENMAWVVAERLRKAVGFEPISLDGVEGTTADHLAITISIGVTTLRQEISLERLVAAADRALYMSKEAGRNRSTALAVEAL